MSLFDAAAYAIGEATAHLLGRVVGRQRHLEPKRAKRIGENIVMAIIIGAGIVVPIVVYQEGSHWTFFIHHLLQI